MPAMSDRQGPTGARKRWSRYFITVSDNIRMPEFNDEAEAKAVKYLELADAMFGDINTMLPHITFERGGPDDIYLIEYEREVEHGDINRIVHMHILFSIQHSAKIKIDYRALKKYFQDGLNTDSIHFFSRIFSDAKGTLENYISKTSDTRSKYDKKESGVEPEEGEVTVRGKKEKQRTERPFDNTVKAEEVVKEAPSLSSSQLVQRKLTVSTEPPKSPVSIQTIASGQVKQPVVKKERTVTKKVVSKPPRTLETSERLAQLQRPPPRLYITREPEMMQPPEDDYDTESEESIESEEEEVVEVPRTVPVERRRRPSVKRAAPPKRAAAPKQAAPKQDGYHDPVFGWVRL